MSDIPFMVAETAIQDAHIPEHPETVPQRTAFDEKRPLSESRPRSPSASISSSILEIPRRRKKITHPPIPDLRFEQSYLNSIRVANGDWKKIAWITLRDQVLFTFGQGLLVALGWKALAQWKKRWSFHGKGLGVWLRRWWWETNNWEIPKETVII